MKIFMDGFFNTSNISVLSIKTTLYLIIWKFVKETVVCEATIFIRMFGTQSLAKNFNVKARREHDNRSDRYAVALQMLRAKPTGILCSLDVRTTFLRVFHLHFFLNFSICRGYRTQIIVDCQDLEVPSV